jgi:hypothetical protein
VLRFFFKKSVGWFEAFILSSLKEMVGEKRMAKYMVQFHTTIFTSMAHITIVRNVVMSECRKFNKYGTSSAASGAFRDRLSGGLGIRLAPHAVGSTRAAPPRRATFSSPPLPPLPHPGSQLQQDLAADDAGRELALQPQPADRAAVAAPAPRQQRCRCHAGHRRRRLPGSCRYLSARICWPRGYIFRRFQSLPPGNRLGL